VKLELPERLQAAVLDDLVTQLQAIAAEETLEIDASKVERIDTAGLQLVLVLEQRTNTSLTVSPAITAAARAVGVSLRSTTHKSGSTT
jgi:ABC-type transporter Mla MlaB component